MSSRTGSRPWRVLLLGGASGVGKTSVSYALARHFGVALCEVDDLHISLKRLTTPAQRPALHFNPAPGELSPSEILEGLLEMGRDFAPGLEAVVANHLEPDTPLVLEGDFILPDLAARPMFENEANGGRVRAVFLHEPDEAQFVANYHLREPEADPQTERARVSWLHDQWLKREAERQGWPVVPARPWASALDRVIDAVEAIAG
jgi:2-phosphoglycerate kinase